jgi:NitT/TauT family transport system permease protein
MILAQQSLRPDTTFAFLIAVGVLGWTLNYSLLAAQRRLFPVISLVGQGGRRND